MEASEESSLDPQPSVLEVAQFMGAKPREVLDVVRRLKLRHEPSLRPLDENSLLFRRDVRQIRFELGYMSADETRAMELEDLLWVKNRRKRRIIAGAVGIYLAILLTGLPEFIGWLAGTREWRGRTFAGWAIDLWDTTVWVLTGLWDATVWVLTGWIGRAVLVLAALFVIGSGMVTLRERYSAQGRARREAEWKNRERARRRREAKASGQNPQKDQNRKKWEEQRKRRP